MNLPLVPAEHITPKYLCIYLPCDTGWLRCVLFYHEPQYVSPFTNFISITFTCNQFRNSSFSNVSEPSPWYFPTLPHIYPQLQNSPRSSRAPYDHTYHHCNCRFLTVSIFQFIKIPLKQFLGVRRELSIVDVSVQTMQLTHTTSLNTHKVAFIRGDGTTNILLSADVEWSNLSTQWI